MMAAQRSQERKSFFSEEKKQKTFIPGAALSSVSSLAYGGSEEIKVFWFFSSEKNILPSFSRH
jgi:hypothetical protein